MKLRKLPEIHQATWSPDQPRTALKRNTGPIVVCYITIENCHLWLNLPSKHGNFPWRCYSYISLPGRVEPMKVWVPTFTHTLTLRPERCKPVRWPSNNTSIGDGGGWIHRYACQVDGLYPVYSMIMHDIRGQHAIYGVYNWGMIWFVAVHDVTGVHPT